MIAIRTIITVVVLAIIAALTILIEFVIGTVIAAIINRTGWSLSGVGSLVALVGLILSLLFGSILVYKFIYSGIRKIPNDPPNKGVLTFFGKRMKAVLGEGWCFLPFYPIVFDVICIDVRKVNQDLPEQVTKTPDFTDLGFNISITWTPGMSHQVAGAGVREIRLSKDITIRIPCLKELIAKWRAKREVAEIFINFLNSGGEERVKNILQDILRDRLRMWAFSGEEGPANWEEAMASKDEAIAILVKAILGEDIPSIISPIPTGVLLKYFNTPPKKPLAYEKKRWGKQSRNGSDWEGLEKELEKLSSEDRDNLKKAVQERQEIINKVRQGDGFFVKKSLGVTINRFTINDVAVKSEDVAKAIAAQVREKHEKIAETIELVHVRNRTKELQKALNVTPEQALEVVQTERGKVVKTVQEKKLNVSAEIRNTIKEIAANIVSVLSK